MENSIIRGLRGIARFKGRDRRGLFWPYAGLILVLGFLAIGCGANLTLGAFLTDASTFAAEHPEAAVVHEAPGQVSIQIDPTHPDAPTPDLAGFFAILGAGVTVIVLLLAAAVARRLHDVGHSAWWGLTPVIFLGVGMALFPLAVDGMMDGAPDLGLFGLLFLNNLLYIVSLGALVLTLVRPGKDVANRFGPPSA